MVPVNKTVKVQPIRNVITYKTIFVTGIVAEETCIVTLDQ